MFDEFLSSLSSANPAIYLIVIIGLLIGSMIFLKKLFNILIIVLLIVALYVGFNYMSGNKIDIDSLSKHLSENISKAKDMIGKMIDNMTGSATTGLEKTSDGKATP